MNPQQKDTFLSAEFHFLMSKDYNLVRLLKISFGTFGVTFTREMLFILKKFKIYPILINPR